MPSRARRRIEDTPLNRPQVPGGFLNPYDEGGRHRRGGSVRSSVGRLGLMVAAGSAAALGGGAFGDGEAHAEEDPGWGAVTFSDSGTVFEPFGLPEPDFGSVEFGESALSDDLFPAVMDSPAGFGAPGWTTFQTPDVSGLVIDGSLPFFTPGEPPQVTPPPPAPEPDFSLWPDDLQFTVPDPVDPSALTPPDLGTTTSEPPTESAWDVSGTGSVPETGNAVDLPPELNAARDSAPSGTGASQAGTPEPALPERIGPPQEDAADAGPATFRLTDPGTTDELVAPVADSSVTSPEAEYVILDDPGSFRAPGDVEFTGTDVTESIDQALTPSPALVAAGDGGAENKNGKFGKWQVRDAMDPVLRAAVVAAAGKLAKDAEATTPTGEDGNVRRGLDAKIEAATLLALDVVNNPETVLVAVGQGNVPVGAGGYQVHGRSIEVTSLITFLPQGNGVGSSVLQAMFRKAQELNPESPLMRLQAHPASEGFYRSVGGTITKEFGVTFVEFRTMPRRSGI